jgi:hypothetical protein
MISLHNPAPDFIWLALCFAACYRMTGWERLKWLALGMLAIAISGMNLW